MDLQELLGREVDLVVEGSHQNSGLCVIRLKKTSSLYAVICGQFRKIPLAFRDNLFQVF